MTPDAPKPQTTRKGLGWLWRRFLCWKDGHRFYKGRGACERCGKP